MYQISKYDPGNYGEGGAYQADEWTSISDIGKKFDKKTLTESEYLDVEESYLNAVRTLAHAAGVALLKVLDLEIRDGSDVAISEGDEVSVDDGIDICRTMLREGPLWCKLDSDGDFYVHIGYDYYMYIGCSGDGAAQVSEIESSGLFVIPNFPSPYLD